MVLNTFDPFVQWMRVTLRKVLGQREISVANSNLIILILQLEMKNK